MTPHRTTTRLALVLASTALIAAPLTGAAHAAPTDPPAPTPPPAASEPKLSSYILNTRKANADAVTQAEKAVRRAGGVVVQSWPQIGVVVAHSTKADFLAKVRKDRRAALLSAGPTRTAPVAEGTPGTRAFRARTAAEPRTRTGRNALLGGARVAAPDPREGEQWNNTLIKADKAHEITDGSRAVTVAVVDSGIEPDHPDLQRNIDVRRSVNCTAAGRPDTSSTGWYPTSSDHGTHVAGTIAAARNGLGIVGVAPGVKLASVKVVNDDGMIYPEYAVCGIMWTAAKKIPVANHSYYVDPFQFWCDDQADQAPAKEAVRRAFAYSHRKGVINAAAAGNSNYDLANKTTDSESPNDSTPIKDRKLNKTCHDIPTELPNVVTVASVDDKGARSGFSNYGAGVIDVAAPGSRILSTITSQRWGSKSGTSMATPHVAGVLALLKSTHRDATPNQLFAMLREQATDTACPTGVDTCKGGPAFNGFFGDGIVDALKAVQR